MPTMQSEACCCSCWAWPGLHMIALATLPHCHTTPATHALLLYRTYARTRQVLQWVLAAAPGHPALRDLCEHIAAHSFDEFGGNPNRATLERTGPGLWTDIILKHARLRLPGMVGSLRGAVKELMPGGHLRSRT